MKSPGVIYRRYRQLKRKILYEKIVQAKRIEHCNCVYGQTMTLPGEGGSFCTFKMCTFDCSSKFDPQRPVICTCPIECNAYVSKWTKEKVLQAFEKELSDWKIKQKLYPELVALEWVLDKDLVEASKNPGFLIKIALFLIMFLERSIKALSPKQNKFDPKK